jgi:hypothetical protein
MTASTRNSSEHHVLSAFAECLLHSMSGGGHGEGDPLSVFSPQYPLRDDALERLNAAHEELLRAGLIEDTGCPRIPDEGSQEVRRPHPGAADTHHAARGWRIVPERTLELRPGLAKNDRSGAGAGLDESE